MQPAVTNTQVSYNVPDGVTVTAIPKASLPSIFIGERLIVYAMIQQSSPPSEVQEGSVCLTGDLLGAKVEHNMKFQIPFAVTKENMLQVSTIHHLAAKKLIKEMKLDLDTSHGERRAEIIQLSCDSNVISSLTAFIAIDEERKEAVKGSLEIWDILPEYEEGLYLCEPVPAMNCYMIASACSQSPSRFHDDTVYGSNRIETYGFPTFGSASQDDEVTMPFSLDDEDYSNDEWEEHMSTTVESASYSPPKVCSKKKSKGMSFKGFSLPKIFGRSKEKSAASTSPFVKEPSFAAEPKKKADKPIAKNPLTIIISLQLASGAWKMSTEVADVIAKTIAELKDSCPVSCEGDMETIWATIIVLVYLQLRQSKFKDEWELVAAKAEAWLTKQNLPQECSIKVLREKGTAFLS